MPLAPLLLGCTNERLRRYEKRSDQKHPRRWGGRLYRACQPNWLERLEAVGPFDRGNADAIGPAVVDGVA